METQVLNVALTQGGWAVLSVALMFYILKVQERRDFKQEKREETYQVIIAELTDRLNLVVEIKEEIRNFTGKIK